MPSTQVIKETVDDDMNQDTPDSDRSDDEESESESGTENEDTSDVSSYYQLQSESNLRRHKGR